MQDHAKKQVKEFLDRIKPFRKAWQSFEIRTGSVVVRKTEFCVIFVGTLGVLPPDQMPAPPPDPSVNAFKADRVVLPFSAFDSFIKGLHADRLVIANRTLRLGKAQQDGTVREALSPSPQFERAGETRWGRTEAAHATMLLHAGGSSLHDASGGVLSDHELDYELRTLKTPYHDVEDMLHAFYKQPKSSYFGNTSKAFFTLRAPVPVTLAPSTCIKDNRLNITIVVEGGLNPAKVDAGLILVPRDGADRREPLPLKRKHWVREGSSQKASLTVDLKEVMSCKVYLSYAGIHLVTRHFENPDIPTANVALNAHRHFDDGMTLYTRWISGAGKNAGRELEKAVGWLFHFCGFRTGAYGGGQDLDNEVDQVCLWDEGKTLVGVECTTKSTDLIQKMKNVFRRCENLNRLLPGWDIVPIVATSMARSELTDTERQTAWTDEVVLLSGDDLKELLHVAERNGTPADVVDLISKGGSAMSPPDNSGMPGMPDRGFRQRF